MLLHQLSSRFPENAPGNGDAQSFASIAHHLHRQPPVPDHSVAEHIPLGEWDVVEVFLVAASHQPLHAETQADRIPNGRGDELSVVSAIGMAVVGHVLLACHHGGLFPLIVGPLYLGGPDVSTVFLISP